jgi:hypothetical protein
MSFYFAPDERDPGECSECGRMTRLARWVGDELVYDCGCAEEEPDDEELT